jgi:tripartite-type tricarboxylate transporter receptor subunit TctC
MPRALCRLSVLLAVAILCIQPSAAQDFYAGKTVNIVVGSAPGGSYDLYARIVGRHIGKYIPGNPTFVVQNMPGANSKLMAGHVYNIAAKDGTVLGAPLNTVAINQMIEGKTKPTSTRRSSTGSARSRVRPTCW